MTDIELVIEKLSNDRETLSSNPPDVSELVERFSSGEIVHIYEPFLKIYERARQEATKGNTERATIIALTALHKCMKICPPPQTVSVESINLAEINTMKLLWPGSTDYLTQGEKKYFDTLTTSKQKSAYWSNRSKRQNEKLFNIPPTIIPQAIPIFLARHAMRYEHIPIARPYSIVIHGKPVNVFRQFAEVYGDLIVMS